jgi:hypothetical protein
VDEEEEEGEEEWNLFEGDEFGERETEMASACLMKSSEARSGRRSSSREVSSGEGTW